MGCLDETVLIPIRDAAQNSEHAPKHYHFLLDVAAAAEQVRDRDVAARDSIIRKIFDAGLVAGGRRWARSGAQLTIEEADVLETIVPLHPVPAGA